MRFEVLGSLEVWTTDGTSVRVPELKVRALLADLLVHLGRPVSADQLIEDLWGTKLPNNPAGVLQRKVWQLRRTLEDAEPGGRELVVSRPPGYLLQVDADAVDTSRFQDLTTRARATENPHIRAALMADALALWRGPAFADFRDDEFTMAAVVRLEEQRLTALEDQAEARLALGKHGLLADELGDLVIQHPLRERLRITHVRALYRSGRQSDALASYGELRDRLAEDLGLDPSPELAALHQAILEQDPALDAVPSPAVRPPTNLPAPLTDLIGRTDTVTEIRSLLDSGRLVTLTGPGGVGKTRLALETAAQLAESFSDGVWLAEFAGLDPSADPDGRSRDRTRKSDRTSAPAEVAEVVAAALGIRDHATAGIVHTEEPAPLTDWLIGALRGKQMLLVLDNCEHVIGPVAELSELLLKTAPGLRILATSQEPLGIPGEHVRAVPPLELPPAAGEAGGTVPYEFSAVRLFVTRAAAAAPGFTLDADNAEAVAAICRRLDGIPLALEMAATRVRALGVHELAARLDDRFHLLVAGKRGAPSRQRTLRAVINWSWDLLGDKECAVLRRIAVHSDGCTLAAAEEICTAVDVDRSEVLDLLARLVDCSLVTMADGADGPRYRLLESVLAYCLERLDEAGERERFQRRHRLYYTTLAERAEPHLHGHAQRQWLRRLDAETANLRSALESAVQHGEAEAALRLANAMTWYWYLRGRRGEARRSLAMALAVDGAAPAAARAKATAWRVGITLQLGAVANLVEEHRAALRPYEEVDDPGGQARAEWFLGSGLYDVGDLSPSEDLVNRALATFRSLGDRWGTAAALSSRSFQAKRRGDFVGLKRDGEQSLALFRELGDHWGQLQATVPLSTLAEIVGDYELAARLYRDGLRIAEELGLWPEVSFQLSGLGRIALLTGDFDQAREFHERARRLAIDQSDKFGEQFAEIGHGLGARREGKLDTAEAHMRHVLELHRQMGYEPGMPALLLAELGFIAELRGDPEAARALHLESLGTARATGDPRAIALALEGLAGAQALAGHSAHAARLLGAAAAARESAGAPLPPAEHGDVDRITARTKAALGEETFASEFECGGELQPDEYLSHRPSPREGTVSTVPARSHSRD